MTGWTVGATLGPLVIEPISRTTLALFAGGSGDHNPLHIDLDAARAAGHPDVLAHGMLGMAYLGRLLTESFPQSRLRTFTTRFVATTPVGAQPICRGTVTAVDATTIVVALTVELSDGTVTLTGTAEVAVDDERDRPPRPSS